MEKKADGFDVTILRPRGKEIPRDVRIGLHALASVIAGQIRKQEGETMGEEKFASFPEDS